MKKKFFYFYKSTFYGMTLALLTLCILETLNRYFANREDPDEMQHNAAFHQGLHCL